MFIDKWGRPELTGRVVANVSMQVHRVRALKTSSIL